MRQINVPSVQRISPQAVAKIAAVDPAVQLTDAGGWYDGEYRETWPDFTVSRFLGAGAQGHAGRGERDRLLGDAEIVLGGWPYPLDLRKRAPKLRWFHQTPAGASNLRMGDLWGSDVMVTTSRGVGSTLAIAEYALAGIMYFAKSFHDADADRHAREFNRKGYRSLLIEGRLRVSWVRVGSARMSAGCVPRSACACWACGGACRRRRRCPRDSFAWKRRRS